MYIEADPTEIGIQGENRLVPIPAVILPDEDRDFAPSGNNSEITKLSALEGLAALQITKSPISKTLFLSASLMLWHLECFSSVNETSFSVRKFCPAESCGKI